MTRRTISTNIFASLCICAASACSGSGATTDFGTSGGKPGYGGSSGISGAVNGGANAAGGALSSGGATDSSGTSAGGASGGGAASNAGSTALSGGTSQGGGVASGGSKAAGGGAMSAGGSSASGGAQLRGGASGVSGGATGSAGSGAAGASSCAYPAPPGSPVALHGQLKVVGTALQDQSGSPTQLKGVSSYWLNWENTKYAESKSALQYMRDNWKLTALRASMGTDASSGYLTSAANQASLQARVDTIVQNALALGVYVLVDWHTEKAVNQQAQSVAFFSGLAQKYGACPNIIYEDYNEPTGVTWAQIKPYHEAVVSAVRAIDPDNLIIMGTPNWSQDVDLAALDPVAGNNLLYTLHWYSCSHKASLRAKGTTAISRGIALFVTEFGATPANGGVAPTNTVCEDEATLWFTWMAQYGIGGISWKLASGTDSSNIFASTSRPAVDGPFPDSVLSQTTAASPGHGQFIVDWLRQ